MALTELQEAAMHYFVGNTDKINGVFDPITCTITRHEGYQSPPEPEPEPGGDGEPLRTAAQRKAEKNRKKREQKKRAKLAAKGKDPDKAAAVTVAANGWSSRAVAAPRAPSEVRAGKPTTHEQALRGMGFGRREREKLATFERLSRLTGIADHFPEELPGLADSLPEHAGAGGDRRPGVNEQLEDLVKNGGSVQHITDARERCARLTDIAVDLVKEVDHIIKYPEEGDYRDVEDLSPLRDELHTLVAELSSRAGEPELMKTQAAERMRQKLERKLLPKLQTNIPKWAEQLRFMHADVLEWKRPEPSKLLVEQEKAEKEAAAAREARLEAQKQAEMDSSWTAPEEVNVAPDDEELRVLEAMGWGGVDDDDGDAGDNDDDDAPELLAPTDADAAAPSAPAAEARANDEEAASVAALVAAQPVEEVEEVEDPVVQRAEHVFKEHWLNSGSVVDEVQELEQEKEEAEEGEEALPDPVPETHEATDESASPSSAALDHHKDMPLEATVPASKQFLAELDSLTVGGLKKRARVLGATAAQIDHCDDVDDVKTTARQLVVAMLAELAETKQSGMKRLLTAAGVNDEETINAIDDADDPKAAAIATLLKAASAASSAKGKRGAAARAAASSASATVATTSTSTTTAAAATGFATAGFGVASSAENRAAAKENAEAVVDHDAGSGGGGDGSAFQIDPTNEFIASPALALLTKRLMTATPHAIGKALFLLGGGLGPRVPWGEPELAAGIAAQGQFHLLREWGLGAPMPQEPDPDDPKAGNQHVVEMILKTISSELQSKAEDSDSDTYSEKAEKFDNEVIEGDSRQAPLTHEEVHAVMNRFAMTNAAGEPQDPSTLPQTTGSNKPQETRLERAIESASLINEARRRGATDMELLACVRTAVKAKVKLSRRCEQKAIQKKSLSSTAAVATAPDASRKAGGSDQNSRDRTALAMGFSAVEIVAARKEELDLVGTHKVLEALGENPPTWRVLDAARFAKRHKEEGDADQVIFADEARALMSWDLNRIARHAMALGIDADFIADVMRSSPSYGSIEEPDALPSPGSEETETFGKFAQAERDKAQRAQRAQLEEAQLRKDRHLRSDSFKEQTIYHQKQGCEVTGVDVTSVEWQLVGPIVSQSKGIHQHLRFSPMPELVKLAEDVGVPKKVRKAARKDRSALGRAILAHRFEFPQPVEHWTCGGLGTKQKDPFSIEGGKKAKKKR